MLQVEESVSDHMKYGSMNYMKCGRKYGWSESIGGVDLAMPVCPYEHRDLRNYKS